MYFASKTMNPHQKNYSVTEQECLAVVWAVELFKTMLMGKFFLLETDHQALRSILTTKNPEGRLARWIIKLQEMDFEIAFRPGARNKNTDFMSREWAPVEEWEDDVPIPGAIPLVILEPRWAPLKPAPPPWR